MPRLTVKAIVDLCVIPIGVAVQLAPDVAAFEWLLNAALGRVSGAEELAFLQTSRSRF